ncbi:unnamed protein product [Caenorhabditis angaria]|uniref:Protein kinase domain-containing protein n=1 Tax=Caenorhabditis angaria TaxID=860376 RepID=A0A9P1I820_9PELO|nr:unnamed protein product [Caenorhabditis angaria]
MWQFKRLNADANQCLISEALYEARIMRTFDHPNVIRIFGVVAESLPIILVIEYIDGKSLLSLLRNCEISNGYRMSFIAGLLFKLLATFQRDGWLLKFSEKIFFSLKSDVWAYGITCWEIFNDGDLPYPNLTNAQIRTALSDPAQFDAHRLDVKQCNCKEKTPTGLADVCRLIFEFDSKKRYDFEKIVPVMEQVVFSKLVGLECEMVKNQMAGGRFPLRASATMETSRRKTTRRNWKEKTPTGLADVCRLIFEFDSKKRYDFEKIVPVMEQVVFSKLVGLECEMVKNQMAGGRFPLRASATMETARRKTTRRK